MKKEEDVINNFNVFVSPLSVNKAWQGKRFKTKDYDYFCKEFAIKLPRNIRHFNEKKEIQITIIFYLYNYNKRDIDNCLKPLLDQLVNNEIILDDRYIKRLIISKEKINKKDGEYIYIDIKYI